MDGPSAGGSGNADRAACQVFWRSVAAVVLSAVQLTGCARVYMRNAHVECPPQAPLAVENAILQALAGRHWTAEKREPGVIVGTLNIRTHQAIIEIDYTDAGYTIRYVGSTNLDYRVNHWGEVLINRHYNWWIEYLVHDINAALGAIKNPAQFKVTQTS